MDHSVVYGVGKAIGGKFKPWGATNLAKVLGKAGAVFAVVGLAWDVTDFFRSEKKLKKLDKKREEIRSKIKEQALQVTELILEDVDNNSAYGQMLDSLEKLASSKQQLERGINNMQNDEKKQKKLEERIGHAKNKAMKIINKG